MTDQARHVESSRYVIDVEPCYRAATTSPISGKDIAAYGDTRHAAQAALRMTIMQEATERGWTLTRREART